MELKRHLELEFSLCDILERWGVPNGLLEIACQMRDAVADCVDRGIYKKTITIVPRIDTKFKSITVMLDAEIDKSKHERESEYSYESGFWCPEIKVMLKGSRPFVVNSVISIMMHELTHSIKDFNENFNDDGIRKNTVIENTEGYKISTIILKNKSIFSRNTVIFAECLYWLSSEERNANIATLEFDLNNSLYLIIDVDTANAAIKSSSLYKKYLNIKNNFEHLCELTDNELNEISNDINSEINNLTVDVDLNFVKRHIQIIKKHLQTFEDKFETSSSKISTEIAAKNNRNIIEGLVMSSNKTKQRKTHNVIYKMPYR